MSPTSTAPATSPVVVGFSRTSANTAGSSTSERFNISELRKSPCCTCIITPSMLGNALPVVLATFDMRPKKPLLWSASWTKFTRRRTSSVAAFNSFASVMLSITSPTAEKPSPMPARAPNKPEDDLAAPALVRAKP